MEDTITVSGAGMVDGEADEPRIVARASSVLEVVVGSEVVVASTKEELSI